MILTLIENKSPFHVSSLFFFFVFEKYIDVKIFVTLNFRLQLNGLLNLYTRESLVPRIVLFSSAFTPGKGV